MLLKNTQQILLQHGRHFSQTLDFACATRTQNQGFEKNGEGIAIIQAVFSPEALKSGTIKMVKPDIKAISEKQYPHFLKKGAASPRLFSKNGEVLFWKSPKPEGVQSRAVLEKAIATTQSALSLLNGKATPEEIQQYKEFIYTCADAVANAAGSELFGSGAKVSKKEAAALTKFKAALAL